MNNQLTGIIVLILFTFFLFFAYFKALQDFKEEKSKEKPSIMFLGTGILFVIIIVDLILQYKIMDLATDMYILLYGKVFIKIKNGFLNVILI